MKLGWVTLAALLYLSLPAKAQTFETNPYHIGSASQKEDLLGGLGAADQGRARALALIALEMLKDFEGWYPSAYNDPVGYCTIGYGHLIALSRCETLRTLGPFNQPLSEESGEALLERDTISARRAVQDLVSADLSADQFSAVASFVFNVGKENFANSTMRRKLNAGDYEAAAKQFPRWVKAKGVVLPGLVTRRSCEETLFRGELKLDRFGRFNRSKCESLGAAPGVGPLVDVGVGELQQ